MPRIAIVILNWNGKDLLKKFLPSVIEHSSGVAEIVVADNASTDDSIPFLRSNFPTIIIIQNDVNGGFAKGYNDALKNINADYFILLNSDVEVTENWITPVIDMMENDKSIAACQSKLLSYINKKQFEYAGAAGGFIDKFGYPFCRGRILAALEFDNGQYDDVREIHWASGACLFIRADLYKKVNGFDEDFFAHMEEIDLCWRLKNLGYKIMYNYKSVVYHLGGATLNKVNPQKTFYNFRNNLILLCKNHAHKFFWIKMFLRMTLDGVASIKFILSGEYDHFWAVLKAHANFYSTIFKTLEKRRAIKKQVKEYSTTAIYRNSIIVDYFFRKKRKFSDLDQSAL